jgi:hypothetical protein
MRDVRRRGPYGDGGDRRRFDLVIGADGQGTGLAPEPDDEGLTDLVDRAINGVELPDCPGVPDSGAVNRRQ